MSAVAPTEEVLREREPELAVLAAALDAAVGGVGRLVLVEGSAGIGKTRLLDELCRSATGAARVLRARGGEQEREIPLLVTRELFAPLTRQGRAEDLDRWFAGAAGLAGPLLGRGSASGADSDFALVHGLYWLVANLADDGPVVLAVDDLHWVDDGTQRWLGYLLPRLAELPVLLACTVRPRELAPDGPMALGLAGHHDAVLVRPGTLSPAAGADLLRSVLPAATDDFCRAAHESTGGNPLLLRSLATAAADVGIPPDTAGARRLDELGPLSVGRIVLPRLHALGGDAHRVAAIAALLGDGCGLRDVAAVADLARAEAAAHVDALVAKGIVEKGEAITFTHPLVRAAVVGEMADGARRSLHLRAARELHGRGAPPDVVARHLAAADPVGESWAVDVLRAAAADAAATGSPSAAIAHLTVALRESTDRATRFGLLLDAGWQAFRSRDARGGDWLDEALLVAPDPGSALIAWIALANWRSVLEPDRTQDDLVDRLPRDLDPILDRTLQGIFLTDFGFSGADLRSRVDRDVDVDPAIADAVPLWWAGRAIDEVMTGGSARAAVDFARRSRPMEMVARMDSDFATLAWILVTLLTAGEFDEFEALSQAAVDDAVRRGSHTSAEWYALMGTYGELCRGDVADAESTMFTWFDHSPEPTVPLTTPNWVAILALVHLERGRVEDARDALARFGLWEGRPLADPHGAMVLTKRALVKEALGQHESAVRDHVAAGEILASFGSRDSVWVVWRPGAVRCLATLRRVEEARELAEEQLAIARRYGARPLLGLALRTLGRVVGGAEGLVLVEEAVEVLEGSGAEGELTAALLDRGRLLRLARRPADARHVLEGALDRADRSGALLLADEVEQELRLCGARPGRRAVTGVRSLTPAELRVATLASEGHTNPEIAQRLFVTRKTVEKHLGAAFAKLHISSRDQLPAVLSGG